MQLVWRERAQRMSGSTDATHGRCWWHGRMLHPSDRLRLMPQLWADVVLTEQMGLAAVSLQKDAFGLPLSQTTLEGRSRKVQAQR